MRFFFFGTLMDPDVRAFVLGRAMPADAIGPATILGQYPETSTVHLAAHVSEIEPGCEQIRSSRLP